MVQKEVTLVAEDGIATITLNRPQAMNAMTMKLYQDFLEVLEELQTQGDIRVVVITGAGNKSFSVGGDIKELEALTADGRWEAITKLNRLLNTLENLPVPVIAAINGFALGGGLELAIACDIRVAAEHASFGVPEVTIGGFPGCGGTVRTPRLIGKGRAKELLFTGRIIDAKEAERIGLVERIVPSGELMSEAYKLAGRIRDNGPLGVRALKKLVNRALEADFSTAMALSDALRRPLLSTRDYTEGLAAFREKRSPSFIGE